LKRDVQYVVRTLARWAIISISLSALFLMAAGTMHIASIRAYLVTFSSMSLVTMLAVDPRLARERAHTCPDAVAPHLRFAAAGLFLLTLTTAAFAVGRLRVFAVTTPLRWIALLLFFLSSALQTWAMISNTFFSPALRIQSERGHCLIDSGPYRFVRHPGYLAMSISMPASAVAIGSWLGLLPATAFVIVIRQRAEIEDQFLRVNLAGYVEYTQRVRSGLLLAEGPSTRHVENARSLP